MEYRLYYTRRGSSMTEHIRVEARLLNDALQKFCNQCINEDDTGIFCDLEDADVDYLSKNPKFHKVHTQYGDSGIVLKDVKIFDPYRNQYLLDLRAKRELLGLTVEDMAERSGQADYKDRESGHRKVTIDDYARYMNILDDYEKGE